MQEDEIVAALEKMQMADTSENETKVPHGMRPCPICREKMKVEVMQHVDVDVCPQHGMWLDNGELPVIILRASTDVKIRTLDAIRQAKREGKLSGAVFGIWSLLFD